MVDPELSQSNDKEKEATGFSKKLSLWLERANREFAPIAAGASVAGVVIRAVMELNRLWPETANITDKKGVVMTTSGALGLLTWYLTRKFSQRKKKKSNTTSN